MNAKVFHDQLNIIIIIYIQKAIRQSKALLSLQGICKNNLRLPLVPISNKLYRTLKFLIMKLIKILYGIFFFNSSSSSDLTTISFYDLSIKSIDGKN